MKKHIEDRLQDLEKRVGELEKRVDISASTYHNSSVDSLKAWRRKGGLAKAGKMTPAERSAMMRGVVQKRWAARKKESGE